MSNKQYKFNDNASSNNIKITFKKYLPIIGIIAYIIMSLCLMFISIKKDYIVKYSHNKYNKIIEYILPTISYLHQFKNSTIESITDLYIDIGKLLNIDKKTKIDNSYNELKKLSISALLEENKKLKKALNFKAFNHKRYITTKIIFNTMNPINTIIYIQAGKKDGILLNSAVVSYNNVLLGKVIEVNDNYSKIMLLNDICFNIAAITEKTKKKIIINGTGKKSDNMKILFIDNKNYTNLIKGEKIVTLDNFPNFPANIIIGTIYENNLAKTAIDFNDIYTVMVVNID